MSTPSEGPPPRSWEQFDAKKAGEVFASLNQSEQQALMRSIRTHEILAPVHNAVERTVAFTRASIEGLSDYAQQLAVGARLLGQAGMERVGQVRDAATQFRQNTAERAGAVRENASNRGSQLSARAAEMVKSAREGVTTAVQWTTNTASNVANRAVEGVNAGRQMAVNAGQQAMDAGRQAVDAGRQTAVNLGNQAVGAGRQAVEAGREAAGKAGRWFNNQISNAAMKASATFAGIAQRRQDPALQGPDLKLPDNLRIVQHMTEIASAQTPDQLNKAMGNLSTFANERLSQMQGAQSGVAEAQNAARVAFSGVGERAGDTPPRLTGEGQGNQQGAQTRPDLTKGHKPSSQTPER